MLNEITFAKQVPFSKTFNMTKHPQIEQLQLKGGDVIEISVKVKFRQVGNKLEKVD